MSQELRIGAVAAEIGISPSTLRSYEMNGKIPPAGRSRKGQRVYLPSDIPAIEAAIFGGDQVRRGTTTAEEGAA